MALPFPWPQDGIRLCVKRAADTFLASASGFRSERERETVCVGVLGARGDGIAWQKKSREKRDDSVTCEQRRVEE